MEIGPGLEAALSNWHKEVNHIQEYMLAVRKLNLRIDQVFEQLESGDLENEEYKLAKA